MTNLQNQPGRPLAARGPHRLHATSERGFTLAEMLAVIAIIGVLAAASAPSIVHYLRDRRVNNAGSEIANLYRYARARSMGRGSAVNVRFTFAPASLATLDPLDPDAHFAVREAVLGGAAVAVAGIGNLNVAGQDQAMLGVPQCRNTVWGPGAATHYVASVDERRARYYPAQADFLLPGSPQVVASNDVDVCYTPRGRVFMDDQSGFNVLAGVAAIRISNQSETQNANEASSPVRRLVILPPNGAARYITELQN